MSRAARSSVSTASSPAAVTSTLEIGAQSLTYGVVCMGTRKRKERALTIRPTTDHQGQQGGPLRNKDFLELR